MRIPKTPLAVMLLALVALAQPATAAAESADAKPAANAITASDPHIPIVELDIIAAPLPVDELKVEADAWLALVRQAAEKVAQAKLRVKRQDEKEKAAKEQADQAEDKAEGKDGETAEQPGEAPPAKQAQAAAQAEQADAAAERADQQKDQELDELTRLRAERTALIDRLDVILQRMNQKLGLDENGLEKPEVMVYRRYIQAVGGIKLDVSDAESAIASITGWLLAKDGGQRWLINIATFLGILVAFWILATILSRATSKALALSGNSSVLLSDFLVGMVRRVVILVGLIVGLAALEINIGPLLAVIGAAGFVVAFALQDTLGNFASGIMIMLYRPFDVGHVVEVAGVSGVVKSLNLVSTTIDTFDNKRMVVPNNAIWGNIITNATGSTTRRVDMSFGIGYDDDIGQAKKVLETIVTAHPKVLKEPAPVIQLHELGDSSVNFICRPWAQTGDYWSVYWDITREVKERFDAAGISIPFPQRDVHIYQEQSKATKADSRRDDEDTDRGAEQMGLEEAGD